MNQTSTTAATLLVVIWAAGRGFALKARAAAAGPLLETTPLASRMFQNLTIRPNGMARHLPHAGFPS